MSRSEIFEEYAKIMESAGLLKTAEESKELKEYKNSVNARNGSDDISTIEALYGVKPDSSIEYERNIIEAAHPKSIVIAPSYDKINALVENENERQDIILNQIMQCPNGNPVQKRLAKQELLMELVKIANDMDNADNDELRKLADICIDGLTGKKRIEKKALAWFVIGGIILAGLYLIQRIQDVDHGLEGNIDNAIKELDDLKTNSWYESDVDDVVQRDVDLIETQIQNLKGYVADFNQVMSTIYKPRTLDQKDELNSFYKSIGSSGSNTADKILKFVDAIKKITPMLSTAIENFKSATYQKMHTKPGFMAGLTGWVGETLHGRWGLVANDFISAANALETLNDSLGEAVTMAKQFENNAHINEEKLENVHYQNVSGVAPKENGGEMKPVSNQMNEEEDTGSSGGLDMSEFSNLVGKKPDQKMVDFMKYLEETQK